MDAELLALLLAAKAQMEADAVELESTTRWCRSLDDLIEQDAMPKAWDRLVAYLSRFAERTGSDDLQHALVMLARNALQGTGR